MTIQLAMRAFNAASVVRTEHRRLATAPSITNPRLEPPEQPSELIFEEWAYRRPRQLVTLLSSDLLDPADTALAIEVAARMLAAGQIVPTLLELLRDSSAIVRESSVYGLARHAEKNRQLRSALQDLTRPDTEPSGAVREAAADVLAWLNE